MMEVLKSFNKAIRFSLLFIQVISIAICEEKYCTDYARRHGSCVPLSRCPHLVEQYYQTNLPDKDMQTYLSDFLCDFDGKNFHVCCVESLAQESVLTADPTRRPPKQLQPFVSSDSSASGSKASSNIFFYFSSLGSFNQSISLSPATIQTTSPTRNFYAINPSLSSKINSATIPDAPNCGISRRTINRVVGGSEAQKGAYPWIAALGYRDDFDRNLLKFLCSGSLITPRFILTSAHCISPSLYLVRLGAHNLSIPKEPHANDFFIKRTVLHDDYDSKTISNDIALVELSSNALTTEYIGIICLPEGNQFLKQNIIGMHPFVAGWGAVKHQGPVSNVIRDVQVPIISTESCLESYKTILKFSKSSEKLICAGSASADACQGDSGGPLMIPQLVGNMYRYFLLGIVSYGFECAHPSFPGVYTNINYYLSWIQRHINSIV